MEERVIKSGFASLATVWAYFVGNVTPIFILLVFFQVLDYVTGMTVAKYYPTVDTDGWNSKTATQGAIKKISYFALVCVAWGMDLLIIEAALLGEWTLGIRPCFGVFATIYLVLTEAISILENLHKMGISLPFLTDALKVAREKISKTGSDKQ